MLVYGAVGLLSYTSAFIFDYLEPDPFLLWSPWKFPFNIKWGLDILKSPKLGFSNASEFLC